MTTLARLSFRVPAKQSTAFERAYEQQLAPLLKPHGLVDVPEKSRLTKAGLFSRFFAVDSPAAVLEYQQRLQRDRAWQHKLQRLTDAWAEEPDHNLQTYHFGLYRTPAGSGRAVEAGPGFRQGMWHSFSVRDGLPYSVNGVLQDRDGALWLATSQGVSRFDGAQFTFFTTADGLPSNFVNALLQDRQGDLWFTTGKGVSRFDGQQFTTFNTWDGLASDRVTSILEDCLGQLWFGTRQGVSCYDGRGFSNFTTADGLMDNQINAILEDRQRALWFATKEGVSCYDGTSFANYFIDGSIEALGEDGQATLWAGSREGQLYRREGSSFAPVLKGVNGGISAIFVDGLGQLWCAAGLEGILRFDGAQWASFTQADGLANNQVSSIGVDRQGNLWFGTHFGISRYDQVQLTHFTTSEGLVHNGVMSMIEDRQGHLWFGTWEGVSCYDGKVFTSIEQLAGWHVWSMLEDRQGHLWFACAFGSGVMRYDGEGYTHYTSEDGLAENQVRSILEDAQGRLWFGCAGGGISWYDRGQFTPFIGAEDLADKRGDLTVVLQDRQGRLWFGCAGGGGGCYDGGQFTSLSSENGLVDSHVCSMLEDRQGRLWFGNFGGVSCWDGKSFTTFTPADGLAYGRVLAMLEDQRGHLWFGCAGGISRYDGQVFQTLSHVDGLVYDVVQTMLQDRNGDVWIGTEGGITRYRPSSDLPRVRLQAVIADQRYAPDSDIQLSEAQKLIVFEFQGYSMTTSPPKLAYFYQLEGCDADWQPTYDNRVEYQALPLGEYTFRVRAVDRDLNYSEEARVRLTVEPDALVESLTAVLEQSNAQGEFVGQSAALRQVLAQLHQLAPSGLTVLILGETGTGKGLAARTLHELSPQQNRPFVQLNCGAIPEPLVESELFGHERGAFTGATSRRLGKVELARNGTLFLDEIGDMSPNAQIKLLRLLEERTFERVGGTQVLQAEVRLVAATNRDLHQMVQQGSFRQDLYFRLQGFEIQLPPLRQRQDDIALLAFYFIGPKAAHLGKEVTGLSPGAEAALLAHNWPGNVRELQHAIERAVVMCKGAIIEVEDLNLRSGPGTGSAPGSLVTLEENERRHIQMVLAETAGRISGPQGAATILGLPESTLRARMKKLGLQRK